MADLKLLKYLLVQVVVLLSVIAITGNLTANFWERYVRRNEIKRIRSSLHTLKHTITKIGNTYDNLHEEITGLAVIPNGYLSYKKTNKNTAAKKLQVFLMENPDNVKVNEKLRDKANFIPHQKILSNATTITRYPLKSTGVGLKFVIECPNDKECKYTCMSKTKIHRCFKDYITRGCKCN